MIHIHPDVKMALEKGLPIVALESTIISHGLPYPDNIEVAKTLEKIIRESQAVPATIGIISGVIHVGLTEEELHLLATEKVEKVSKRDVASVIANKQHGATTVSGTMLICNMVGIKVFATGGIGGVHRGATKTFDISRDLEELANTNVCVVCAGAKSILDLALTLEYLETKGVEVIGYQTDVLPSFYARTSKHKLVHTAHDPETIAHMMQVKWDLHIQGGMVVANPIPEAYSMAEDEIETVISKAIKSAEDKGIVGKEMTPFLLETIKNMTQGKSLEANKSLVYHNAKLAANIAGAYAQRKQ